MRNGVVCVMWRPGEADIFIILGCWSQNSRFRQFPISPTDGNPLKTGPPSQMHALAGSRAVISKQPAASSQAAQQAVAHYCQLTY